MRKTQAMPAVFCASFAALCFSFSVFAAQGPGDECRELFRQRSPMEQLRAHPGRSFQQAILIERAEAVLKRGINWAEADALAEAHRIGQEGQAAPEKGSSDIHGVQSGAEPLRGAEAHSKEPLRASSRLRAQMRVLKAAFPSKNERRRIITAALAAEGEKSPAPEEHAEPSASAERPGEWLLEGQTDRAVPSEEAEAAAAPEEDKGASAGFGRLGELRLRRPADQAALAAEDEKPLTPDPEEDKELLALSEQAMSRLLTSQKIFLGLPVNILRRSFFIFALQKRRMIEELRVSLGIEPDQPVAKMMSKIALEDAAGGLEETEPLRFFRLLLAERDIEISYISPQHIELLKSAAQKRLRITDFPSSSSNGHSFSGFDNHSSSM